MGTLAGEMSSLFEADQYECTFSSDLQCMARRDLKEDRISREEALQELREWVQKNPNISRCRMDATFLLRFLRANKFRVPHAKVMLERYLTARIVHPHWYQQLDIMDPELDDLISRGFIFALPERDDHGRRVIMGIGSGLDPSRHTTSHTMRAFVMTFETLLEDETNQVRGFTYIFDQQGVGLRAATLWTPNAFRKALYCSERSLPMRHKQCHFVHLPVLIAGIFEFFKSFLSPKLRERVMLHHDIGSLCEYVPLEILPREYGGQMPVEHMIGLWKQELMSKREHLLSLDLMQIEIPPKPKKSGYFWT